MLPLPFSDRARKTMQLASQEAFELHHEYVGSEHILLGLFQEGSGVTPSMWSKFEYDLGKLRAELEKYVKRGRRVVKACKLPFTPIAEKVLHHAHEETRIAGHVSVQPEYILLGLLGEKEGIAYQVLIGCGLQAEKIRAEANSIPKK